MPEWERRSFWHHLCNVTIGCTWGGSEQGRARGCRGTICHQNLCDKGQREQDLVLQFLGISAKAARFKIPWFCQRLGIALCARLPTSIMAPTFRPRTVLSDVPTAPALFGHTIAMSAVAIGFVVCALRSYCFRHSGHATPAPESQTPPHLYLGPLFAGFLRKRTHAKWLIRT